MLHLRVLWRPCIGRGAACDNSFEAFSILRFIINLEITLNRLLIERVLAKFLLIIREVSVNWQVVDLYE